MYHCYFGGNIFKESNFWRTSEVIKLEIILYHDDFNAVNPLGNKKSKHEVSVSYFVFGDLPTSYKFCLTDIHLVGLTQAKAITNYGYENFLGPLINDLIVLVTQDLDVLSEGKTIHFPGSLKMFFVTI